MTKTNPMTAWVAVLLAVAISALVTPARFAGAAELEMQVVKRDKVAAPALKTMDLLVPAGSKEKSYMRQNREGKIVFVIHFTAPAGQVLNLHVNADGTVFGGAESNPGVDLSPLGPAAPAPAPAAPPADAAAPAATPAPPGTTTPAPAAAVANPATEELIKMSRVAPADVPSDAAKEFARFTKGSKERLYRKDVHTNGTVNFTAHYIADDGKRYYLIVTPKGKLVKGPLLSNYQPG